MKRIRWAIIFFGMVSMSVMSWAANIYYISPSGSDTLGTGSGSNPWATLSKAFSVMTGGDTLKCKNGIYVGDKNKIDINNAPPVGASGSWTNIIAETDGGVVFDGENMRRMFYFDPIVNQGESKYWNFVGLIWQNSQGCAVQVLRSQHIKFTRCGFCGADSASAALYLGKGANNCLVEESYAWGDGRYKFEIYQSSHTILRSCVARFDRVWNPSNPIAVYAVYSAYQCILQNCIAIDSDQTSHYVGVGEAAGCFSLPATDAPGSDNQFINCVGVNSRLGLLQIDGNMNNYSTKFENCCWLDIQSLASNRLAGIRGVNSVLLNCTIINTSGTRGGFGGTGPIGTTIKNCVFHSNNPGSDSFFINIATHTYNSYYSVTNMPVLSTGETSAINSLWTISNVNGGIKYLPSIEIESNLTSIGENGAAVGANIASLMGTPGTLWGDPGYNTNSGVSMWPFPNEALIRLKMRAYNYTDSNGTINGARGFCADGQSLTKYIWGYLGNPVPADKTRSIEGKVVNSRGVGVPGVSMVISDGISDTAVTEDAGSFVFAGLPIASDYTITPDKIGFTFSPPSRTIANFSGTLTNLNFTANGLGVQEVVQAQELRVVGSASQQGTVNPTKGDSAKIYFQGTATGTYECRIFDINRTQVWHDTKDDVIMGIFEWFPKDMPSGGYIVNVQGPGYSKTNKIAVLK